MRTRTGFIGCVAVGLVCLFAAAFAAPAGAITGGTDDDPTNPRHPEVGLVVFYQSDGRFRCSGTLIDPQVVLTAGHCTFGDVGKVIVTFDTQVAQSIEQGRLVVPRALDDPGTGLEGSGYDDGLWVVETDAEGTPLICGRRTSSSAGAPKATCSATVRQQRVGRRHGRRRARVPPRHGYRPSRLQRLHRHPQLERHGRRRPR